MSAPTPPPPPSVQRVVHLIEKRVRRACVVAIAALLLIAWSQVHPKPLPVVAAMTIGQVIGTLSLLLFLHAIVADLKPVIARIRRTPPVTEGGPLSVEAPNKGEETPKPPSGDSG